MSCVDLSDPQTWPAGANRLVEDKAAQLAANASFKPRQAWAYDLALDRDLEDEIRQALTGHLVLVYHATRLLPPEVQAIRDEGLRTLTDELRTRKLVHAANVTSEQEAMLLESSGPLHWGQAAQEVRRGTISVFGPYRQARNDHGLRPLLAHWGGESICFGSDRETGDRPAILTRLRSASQPAFIELAAQPNELCWWTCLWPAMVGYLLRMREPWNQWTISTDIPPDRVLDVVQPGHRRWPRSVKV